MIKRCVLLLAVLLSSPALSLDEELHSIGTVIDGVRHVDASKAAELLESFPQVQVLDVRTGFEYNRGHLSNAVNVNYYSRRFKQKLDQLDKKTTWLVHCRTGARSGKSLPILKSLGFTSIIHLDGGISAWSKGGFPVTKK